ncbi:MAG: hypothetical protein QM221_09420 [Bacillota bacterium]|jgi:hypothetical protein|nr:hypothetical protein [Bacillota bacterium]
MPLEIIFSCVSTIIAIVAAVFALWSAHEARVANKKAEEANSLAKEANKISQQALELQESQAPAPWSEIIKVSKDSYLLENRSGKNAIITKIQAIPEEAAGLLIAEGLPKFVAYGDNYKFMIVRVMGTGIGSIKVKWHFEDEPETEHEVVRNAN